jgi:hypothetical protein
VWVARVESRAPAVQRPSPGEIRNDLSGGSGQFRWVAETFDPGWTAEVDGKATPVVPHRGTFLGAPASGAVLSFKTADRYELRDGMLFEHWDVVDRLDAMVGLGLLHQGPADSGRD